MITQGRSATLFCAALLVLFASKGAAFLPGYGLDDYAVLVSTRDPLFTVSQGRFTQSLIQVIQNTLGLKAPETAWPALVMLLLAMALAICYGIEFATRRQGSLGPLVAAASLMAAYPYFSEYLAFREAILPQAVSIALLAYVLVTLALSDDNPAWLSGWRRASRILALVFLAGCQQTAYIVVVFFVFGRIVSDSFPATSTKSLRDALYRSRTAVVDLLISAFVYVGVALLLRFALGAALDERGTLISLGGIGTRVQEVYQLLHTLLASDEPLVPRPLKLATLAIIAWASVQASLTAGRFVMLALAFWGLMVLASILLVTVSSVWWPVPRAIYALGFAHGLVLVILAARISKFTSVATVAIGLLAVGFAFKSNQVIAEQQRLNRWDMWVASTLAQDLIRRDIRTDASISLVGASWRHPVGLRTTQGDLNTSALPVSWAVTGLFREATGQQWTVSSRPSSSFDCSKHGYWPDPKGIIQLSANQIIVCMR